MKITTETSLINFSFWSQGMINASKLSYYDLNRIERVLNETYPDGMSDTELNDLFWHDFDTVLDWIGTDYETLTEEQGE